MMQTTMYRQNRMERLRKLRATINLYTLNFNE